MARAHALELPASNVGGTLVAIDTTTCWGYDGEPCKHVCTFARKDGSVYMDMVTRRNIYDLTEEQLKENNDSLVWFTGVTCPRHVQPHRVTAGFGEGNCTDSSDSEAPSHALFGDGDDF